MKLAIFVVSFMTLCSVDIVVSAHLFYWRMKDRTGHLMQASALFPHIFKNIMLECLQQGYPHNEHVPSRPREVLGFDIQYCAETATSYSIEDEENSCHKSFMFIYDSKILDLLETVGYLLHKYEEEREKEIRKEISDCAVPNATKTRLDSLQKEIKQKLKGSVIVCSSTDQRNYIQLLSAEGV